MVKRKLVPTAKAEAGATSNCGAAPLVSMCGDYQTDPFLATGEKSNRIFRDAGGGFDPATD